MGTEDESPEDRREKLRQKELKKPSSSIHGSNLSDLVGALGWKGTGMLILLLIIAYVMFEVFS